MASCPSIPEEAYSIFSLRVHEKVARDRIPIGGTLELTMSCNLRCVHCYCEGSRQAENMLTTSGFIDVIDQVADAGCMWLLLTGGEPLLNPGFEQIYIHAKRRGIFITLFTNATCVTPEIAGLLSEWRPFSIEVTIYGGTRETYEKVSGVSGSYDRCLEGIDRLVAHGFSPKLKTMALRENVHELDQMQALAEERGLEFRFDAMLNPTVGGDLNPVAHRLDPETILELDRRYDERIDAWKDFMKRFGNVPPSETLYSCGAGMNTFHIDPEGKLYLCLLARHVYYDLRSGSFEEGWNGFIRDIRFQKPAKMHRCGTCRLRSLCACCPAWAALETGEPHAAIIYLCRVAALRARAFGGSHVKNAGRVLLDSLDSRST